jgi:hypothetical protein
MKSSFFFAKKYRMEEEREKGDRKKGDRNRQFSSSSKSEIVAKLLLQKGDKSIPRI